MITKIIEELARKELEVYFASYCNTDINIVIQFLKNHNFIKKSAKEEFEEYIKNQSDLSDYLVDLFYAAIEEEYQRGFAAGCKGISAECEVKAL